MESILFTHPPKGDINLFEKGYGTRRQVLRLEHERKINSREYNPRTAHDTVDPKQHMPESHHCTITLLCKPAASIVVLSSPNVRVVPRVYRRTLFSGHELE